MRVRPVGGNMNRKVTHAAAMAAVTVGMLVGPATLSADASHNCVTRGEYRRVERGMTKDRVHRIFDFRGRRDSLFRTGRRVDEFRSYRLCFGGRGSEAFINYDNYTHGRPLRVFSKSLFVIR